MATKGIPSTAQSISRKIPTVIFDDLQDIYPNSCSMHGSSLKAKKHPPQL